MAKKYIDAELLRKETTEFSNEYRERFKLTGDRIYLGVADGLDVVERVIDTLRQEQSCDTCTNDKGCVTCKDGELWEGKEQPSEELEEAAEKHASFHPAFNHKPMKAAFIAGAEWQAERLLKGSPIPEDTVIFQKGIEEGKRLMMEEAVEGMITCANLNRYILVPKLDESLTYGDKVKIIIVKEDKK